MFFSQAFNGFFFQQSMLKKKKNEINLYQQIEKRFLFT